MNVKQGARQSSFFVQNLYMKLNTTRFNFRDLRINIHSGFSFDKRFTVRATNHLLRALSRDKDVDLMKLLTLTLLLIFVKPAVAQQRIGVDFNTRMINGYFTVQYHKVFRWPFIYSVGVCGGSYGLSEHFSDSAQVVNGFHHNSYPTLPEHLSNSDGDFHLLGVRTRGAGMGTFIGIGIFKEFAKLHGFRFNINHYFLWSRTKVRGTYRDYNHEDWGWASQHRTLWHPVGAVSLELYHTIRINGRYTFYWGGKFPYFYSMDKAKYNPRIQGELFYKFLPDISIGFTRAVGKCD